MQQTAYSSRDLPRRQGVDRLDGLVRKHGNHKWLGWRSKVELDKGMFSRENPEGVASLPEASQSDYERAKNSIDREIQAS